MYKVQGKIDSLVLSPKQDMYSTSLSLRKHQGKKERKESEDQEKRCKILSSRNGKAIANMISQHLWYYTGSAQDQTYKHPNIFYGVIMGPYSYLLYYWQVVDAWRVTVIAFSFVLNGVFIRVQGIVPNP